MLTPYAVQYSRSAFKSTKYYIINYVRKSLVASQVHLYGFSSYVMTREFAFYAYVAVHFNQRQ